MRGKRSPMYGPEDQIITEVDQNSQLSGGTNIFGPEGLGPNLMQHAMQCKYTNDSLHTRLSYTTEQQYDGGFVFFSAHIMPMSFSVCKLCHFKCVFNLLDFGQFSNVRCKYDMCVNPQSLWQTLIVAHHMQTIKFLPLHQQSISIDTSQLK